MELTDLITSLSSPGAYPIAPAAVEVRQTHISVVFLAGEFVYKIKKPVKPGFLDFTTLEKRRYFCEEEVRLNRRLAPDVYLGVVPIASTTTGLKFEASGEVVEWAVKMRRLPEEATLLERLGRGEVTAGVVRTLAARLAAFHRGADHGETLAAFGRFEVVSKNFLDLFERAAPQVDRSVPRALFERLRTLVPLSLARLRPLIDFRAKRGCTLDGHGDLHLDHIYLFPHQPPPGDLVIIDCIEFSQSFRALDPIADMAFAAMDLAFHGRRDLARVFADSYLKEAHDAEGRELLAFYTAYRAAVRGMVDGLLLGESEVPGPERDAARVRSLAHWMLALGELEEPGRRPALVLITGLPGSGKSSIAAHLANALGFEVIRSDVIRKTSAGLDANTPTPTAQSASLYTPSATEATYAECGSQAEAILARGGRVIIDANFREDRHRGAMIAMATRLGVPVLMLHCNASEATIRDRLARRTSDASDADWSVYQRLSATWEKPGAEVSRVLRDFSTEGTPAEVFDRAREMLKREGFC